MKHITVISRAPRHAQLAGVDFGAVFTLIADVLTALATAVLAKENQTITLPTSS